MRYTYTAPVAARHEVRWDRRSFPGIYSKAERFASTTLCQELSDWLDANAPGWTFKADWDGFSYGGDDDGCHVTVSSKEEGEGFVAIARAASTRWVDADRESMAHRLVLTTAADGEIEIERDHQVPDSVYHSRDLDRHLMLDAQPMRQRIYRAISRAAQTMRGIEDGVARVEVELLPDDVRQPGTTLAYLKVASPQPTEAQ